MLLAHPLDLYDTSPVGPVADGRTIVPTNQVLAPAGTQIKFLGRPTDAAISPDGRTLAVLNWRQLVLIDLETGSVRQTVDTGRLSYAGILFSPDGNTVMLSSAESDVVLVTVGSEPARVDNRLTIPSSMGGASVPCGMALSPQGDLLYVTLNRSDSLAVVDLARRAVVKEMEVGKAPYGVALAAGKAYVSNWGGRR